MPHLLSPTEMGTILSVWAHPDDETFLAGGIMAAAAGAGQAVVCASATAGEHGTDDPIAWPPDVLGELRRSESAAAAGILGIPETRWLGFEDGSLATVAVEDGVGPVSDLIAQVEPNTILTFGPDGMTGHPDHRTVSAWTTEAWRRSGRTVRLFHAAVTAAHVLSFAAVYEQWGVFMTDDRPGGVEESEMTIAFRLEEPLLARKLAALRAMPSQTSGAFDSMGEEVFGRLNETEWFVEHAER